MRVVIRILGFEILDLDLSDSTVEDPPATLVSPRSLSLEHKPNVKAATLTT